MTEKTEQYLKRIADTLDKIEKHLAPNTIDFTDGKVMESFWGPRRGRGPGADA